MTPASKTQIRVMTIAGLELSDDYDTSADRLESAGMPRDGMPNGETWRSVAKLSDGELMRRLSLTQPIERFDVNSVHDVNY